MRPPMALTFSPTSLVRRNLALAVLAIALLFTGLVVVPAEAVTDPASGPIDQICVATPTLTADTVQSGVPAAAVGETVEISQTIDFLPGTIFQDILTRPDGSTYFASYLELHRLNGLVDAIDPVLTIDDVPQTVIAGTAPDTDDFVLETAA